MLRDQGKKQSAGTAATQAVVPLDRKSLSAEESGRL